MSSVLICDFCGSASPAWEYPCESFTVPGIPPGKSTGGWIACDDCHAVIEKNDREALARRGLLNPSVSIIGPKAALAGVREIHQQFFDRRGGPPLRVFG
jgi:hypothetical protein